MRWTKYHVSYETLLRISLRLNTTTTATSAEPIAVNAIYGSRPVKSKTVLIKPPRTGISAGIAVKICTANKSPIVSPAMRCQINRRSKPMARSIVLRRADNVKPTIPNNDVYRPVSDAAALHACDQPFDNWFQPPVIAHAAVTMAKIATMTMTRSLAFRFVELGRARGRRCSSLATGAAGREKLVLFTGATVRLVE